MGNETGKAFFISATVLGNFDKRQMKLLCKLLLRRLRAIAHKTRYVDAIFILMLLLSL